MDEKNQIKDTEKNFDIVLSTRDISFFRSIRHLEKSNNFDSRRSLTFLFVTKGKIKLEMNKMTIVGKRNDMIVCPPNLVLSNSKTSTNFEGNAIVLSNDFLLSIISNERIKWAKVFNNRISPLVHLDEEFIRVLDIYEKLLLKRVTVYHGRMFEAVVSHLTMAFLCELQCYTEKQGLDGYDSPVPVRQCDVLFKKLITMVNNNISSSTIPNRSIQYYATELNVTPKYLTHVCKLCSGQTAKELIDSILINRIEYLLLRSDLSVKEIAMQLGFPDVSNFGRYVKTKLGVSPRSIRTKAGK
ncbi:MAG: helix-turn-helix domain-containing protein [Muribaculaceae bacterium]